MFKQIYKCRVCNSNNLSSFLLIKKMPIQAEPVSLNTNVCLKDLEVMICNECNYVFLSSVLNKNYYRNYKYTPQFSNDVIKYLNFFTRSLIIDLHLDRNSIGLEIGSGEGSLCKSFVENGINFQGIEPSKILYNLSCAKGIKTYNKYFDKNINKYINRKYDIVVIRHVLEHIDDFDDFFSGISKILYEDGTLVIEVPYLGNILKEDQYYAFFFEHLSYFSIFTLNYLLNNYNYYIQTYKFVNPEGGSVLLYAKKFKNKVDLIDTFNSNDLYSFKINFGKFKEKFYNFINLNKRYGVYGAGQRGITLLNILGLTRKEILVIFDENENYHKLYSPNSFIPIQNPIKINKYKLDEIFILATSYEKQIVNKYRNPNFKFVSIIPKIRYIT